MYCVFNSTATQYLAELWQVCNDDWLQSTKHQNRTYCMEPYRLNFAAYPPRFVITLNIFILYLFLITVFP